MPFVRTKAKIVMTDETRMRLEETATSRIQPAHRVERARILLGYHQMASVSATAERLHINRMTVNRCVNKALALGVEAALSDLPRSGKKPVITQDAISWLVSLACRKPTELGLPQELWTTELLASYARAHCQRNGHPSLCQLSRGTVSKILSKQEVQPHRIQYYLERRDPAFQSKFVDVLLFYKSVNFLLDTGLAELADAVFVSYDEKPGIQAIGRVAPDLPPVAGKHPSHGRDYEYRRHGTVSLMAGIDLLMGHVHSRVVERHNSGEFISFLRDLDEYYPKDKSIRIILDNHSMHTSAETREYLAEVPNRFEFVFTPKHGSWLNLIETFFSKFARTLLRGIRVKSKQELIARIQQYIALINESPVIFRWKYGINEQLPL
jgi:transposase